MSGTINLAFTQQFDAQGDPLSGGLLEFFTAGTTTPQTPYQDTSLSIAHPNPIVLDASGRVPMFYLADGFIKIRLKDKNGVVIIAADQLLVIGPSSGGGGGGSAGDVTRQFDTGDIKARYDNRSINGWVRCNGNTIGATGSGATEPNGIGTNAQALYEYLYQFPSILLADGAVKSGNAVSDFGANKKIILPDLRGRVIAGLDDMGALLGAASRLTSTYWGAVGATLATTLGNVGGDEKYKMVPTNVALPQHIHHITATAGSPPTGTGNFTSGRVTVYQGTTFDHTHYWGNFLGSVSQGNASAVSSGPVNSVGSLGVNLGHHHAQDGRTVLNAGGGSATGGNPSALVGGDTGGVISDDVNGQTDAALTHYHAVGGQTGAEAVLPGGHNTTDHRHTFSGDTDNSAASIPANVVPLPTATPSMVMNIYIKL